MGKDVVVRLEYLADLPLYKTVKPLQVVPGFLDRDGRSNVKLAPGEAETIHDVRLSPDKQFTLDDNGFVYIKAPTRFKDWTSQKAIGEVYLQEMEDLLRREVPGCSEFIFFDARIRQSGPEGTRVQGLSYNPFAYQVHVDQTESSIITKVRNLTEIKSEYLLKGRTQIIIIWRPIKHPVYDCALAVADGATLLPGDVIECDRERLDTGEFWDTMGVVKQREGYDWHYMSEQAEEDVLLFKNYDSDDKGAPTRESIEVRAMVFTYPKDDSGSPARGEQSSSTQPLRSALQHNQLTEINQQESIVESLKSQLVEKEALIGSLGNQLKENDSVAESFDKQAHGHESLILKRHIEQKEKAIESLEKQVEQMESLEKQVEEQGSLIESLQVQLEHAISALQSNLPAIGPQETVIASLQRQLRDAVLTMSTVKALRQRDNENAMQQQGQWHAAIQEAHAATQGARAEAMAMKTRSDALKEAVAAGGIEPDEALLKKIEQLEAENLAWRELWRQRERSEWDAVQDLGGPAAEADNLRGLLETARLDAIKWQIEARRRGSKGVDSGWEILVAEIREQERPGLERQVEVDKRQAEKIERLEGMLAKYEVGE